MELQNDQDKEFILNGLREGFSIVDTPVHQIPPSSTANHSSALSPENRSKVEEKIREELSEGHYVITDHTPRITSALAAIPKPDGDIRLIHDFSRPENSSVNDFAVKDACVYQSLDDAIDLLSPSSFIAKVDLKAAYRSVAIRSDHHVLTGLCRTFGVTILPLISSTGA